MKALWRKKEVLILTCWLRGDSCSGASAPWAEGSGSGQSPAGWSSQARQDGSAPWMPSRLDTTPGPVSLGCLHGIAKVLLRYLPGVSPMLMPSTWEQHASNTVAIPCIHRACWLGGMLGAARGCPILRKALATAPLAGNRPGLFIFTTSAWRSRRGPASNACLSGAGLAKVVFMPPSLKSRRGSVQRKR